jgi:hypothetical protein
LTQTGVLTLEVDKQIKEKGQYNEYTEELRGKVAKQGIEDQEVGFGQNVQRRRQTGCKGIVDRVREKLEVEQEHIAQYREIEDGKGKEVLDDHEREGYNEGRGQIEKRR